MSDTENGQELPPMKEDLSKIFDELTAETEEAEVEETEVEEGVEVAEDEVIPPLDAKEEEAEEDTAPPEEESEEEPVNPLEPMEHWHKEDKEMFTELPRDAQEYLIKRDKEFQSSVTGKQMEVADIKRALEPVRKDLDEHGIADADAIRRLVGAHLRLVSKPKEAILELMNSYNIDISDFIDNDGEGKTDLSESAAMQKVKKLEGELKQEREARQATEAAKLNRTLHEFAQSHEFFEDVQAEMTDLAYAAHRRGEEPPPLEELYDRACRLNPSVWEKLQAQTRESEDKEKAKRDKEEAAKAKRAAKTKVRSTPKRASGSGKPAKKTLREELSEEYDKQMQAR